MASNQRQKKRRAIFDQAAKAYHALTGRSEQWYFCPICERAFTEEHLEDGTLTLEHVPPKALGGRELILTCGECNNTSGTKMDSQAAQREDVRAFTKTVATGKAAYTGLVRLELESDELNCSISVDPRTGDRVFSILDEHNEPEAVRRCKEELDAAAKHGTWDGKKLSVTSKRGYHPRRARVSDLRAGYLAAFAKLGYSYAFHPYLKTVREQLRKPEVETVKGFWASSTDSQVIVLSDQPIEALWVAMPQATVLLPWPPSKVDPYQRMAEMHESGSQFTIHGLSMPWPSRPEMALDFLARER